jgi:hypothetical protein
MEFVKDCANNMFQPNWPLSGVKIVIVMIAS